MFLAQRQHLVELLCQASFQYIEHLLAAPYPLVHYSIVVVCEQLLKIAGTKQQRPRNQSCDRMRYNVASKCYARYFMLARAMLTACRVS
jgi:hypothetical protein